MYWSCFKLTSVSVPYSPKYSLSISKGREERRSERESWELTNKIWKEKQQQLGNVHIHTQCQLGLTPSQQPSLTQLSKQMYTYTRNRQWLDKGRLPQWSLKHVPATTGKWQEGVRRQNNHTHTHTKNYLKRWPTFCSFSRKASNK